MQVLGFDTSNYTTSVAAFNGTTGINQGELLTVKAGALGLRQSDALFQHVRALPEIVARIASQIKASDIAAVGASTRPRAVEGSYMPCFLAGESQARNIASVLGVPFYAFSHQQGHLAAILWSSGHMELMEQEFLAWHLSGGTTELLHVSPGLKTEIIGGTTDISAGQLIDRTGQLLGLAFPSGKVLDALAGNTSQKGYAVKVNSMKFSLSGMQNKVIERHEAGAPDEEVAGFALATCVNAIRTATLQGRSRMGMKLPVVFTGGVSSNSLLRLRMQEEDAVFGPPQYSTDNAMGIAVLTSLMENSKWTGN